VPVEDGVSSGNSNSAVCEMSPQALEQCVAMAVALWQQQQEKHIKIGMMHVLKSHSWQRHMFLHHL
jgi:hypothetical protein